MCVCVCVLICSKPDLIIEKGRNLHQASHSSILSLTTYIYTHTHIHTHTHTQDKVVGVNGFLLNLGQSRSWKKEFDPKGVILKALDTDMVDEVWGSDQPPAPGMCVCACVCVCVCM